MLEIQLLGTVRAVTGGGVIVIDSARRRAVLAALALRHGSTVSVAALCEVLWGEELPGNARGNLQSHVSRLRSVLGEDAVVLDHGGYRLATDGIDTDVAVVERLAHEAASLHASSPAGAAALYADALARWRGPALVEFADDPAFLPDAVRLDEHRRALTDDLHEARLDAGQAVGALPAIEAAALSEPLRERSQLLLVRALHDSGRSAEALRAADAFRRRLVEETGLDPSGALAALERDVAAGERPQPRTEPESSSTAAVRARTPTRNLPRSGRFFARDTEVAMLGEAVAAERVVTVVGTGGVGKTRLVAEMLAARVDDTPVTIVELAGASSGEVAGIVAAAVGLTAGAGSTLDVLVEYLSVETMVLVLDNCEHVGREIHELVDRVRAECPGVTVLATSRSRLGVSDERIIPLGPLPAEHDHDPAVELFVDRLGAADPSTPLTYDAREAVREICRRLDGVPLSIELAAGRSAVLGVRELLTRLHEALDLVEMPTLGAERRHATLRSVVMWSYDLLDDDARRVLDALAVFHGSFDLQAAERVIAVSRHPLAVSIGRLVDASLVVVDHSTAAPRYRLLESVRQLAAERLAEHGDTVRIRLAHVDWVAGLLHDGAARSAGPEEAAAIATVEAERENIRVALTHSLQHRTRHVGGLAGDLAELCLYRPDIEWLAWLRSTATDAALDPTGAAAAARAAYLQGDLNAIEGLALPVVDAGATGRPLHLAAHSLAVGALYAGRHAEAERWWRRTLDDPSAELRWRMDALGGVALARCYAGDLPAARRAHVEHQALADAVDSVTYRAFAHYVDGEIALTEDDRDRAVRSLHDAVRLAETADAHFISGLALTALASNLVRSAQIAAATTHLLALLEHWRRSATWPQMWTTLRLTAEALTVADRLADAALLLAAADHDPAAPAVAGPDRQRLAALRARHRSALLTDQLEAIDLRARVTPRARIAAAASAALSELAPG